MKFAFFIALFLMQFQIFPSQENNDLVSNMSRLTLSKRDQDKKIYKTSRKLVLKKSTAYEKNHKFEESLRMKANEIKYSLLENICDNDIQSFENNLNAQIFKVLPQAKSALLDEYFAYKGSHNTEAIMNYVSSFIKKEGDLFDAVKNNDVSTFNNVLSTLNREEKDKMLALAYHVNAEVNLLHVACKFYKNNNQYNLSMIDTIAKEFSDNQIDLINATMNDEDLKHTPLTLLTDQGDMQAVKVLLENKANPLAPNGSLETPVDYIWYTIGSYDKQDLDYNLHEYELKIMQDLDLFERYGATFDKKFQVSIFKGLTPAHIACVCNLDLITKFLMQKNVNFAQEAQDPDSLPNNITPLHCLAFYNTIIGYYVPHRSIKPLIQILKQSGVNLNQQDEQGNTVVHLAAILNNQPVLQELLEVVDFDTTIKNNQGLTVQDIIHSQSVPAQNNHQNLDDLDYDFLDLMNEDL